MSLVYLLASLPYLSLETPPRITPDAFRAACREQLDPPLAAAATALLDGLTDPHPFVRAWQDKETILRNTAVLRRAARRSVEPINWLRPAAGADLRIEQAVEAAFQLADPLARERALDRLRWVVADELQGPDPMSETAVLAYAIRLRLAARWSRLQAEAGRARAAALTDVPLAIER